MHVFGGRIAHPPLGASDGVYRCINVVVTKNRRDKAIPSS